MHSPRRESRAAAARHTPNAKKKKTPPVWKGRREFKFLAKLQHSPKQKRFWTICCVPRAGNFPTFPRVVASPLTRRARVLTTRNSAATQLTQEQGTATPPPAPPPLLNRERWNTAAAAGLLVVFYPLQANGVHRQQGERQDRLRDKQCEGVVQRSGGGRGLHACRWASNQQQSGCTKFSSHASTRFVLPLVEPQTSSGRVFALETTKARHERESTVYDANADGIIFGLPPLIGGEGRTAAACRPTA